MRAKAAPKKRKTATAKQPVVVVDGSNIAHAEYSDQGSPKICNIVSIFKLLKSKGMKPIVIVDAALRHQIDDQEQYEALVRKRWIRQAPSRTVADYFILKTADKKKATIISNDTYMQYRGEFKWIDKRRQPYMIVEGEVMLYDKSLHPPRPAPRVQNRKPQKAFKRTSSKISKCT